ncbi:RICIN domain-containing protein [Streptomyces sp. NPDC006459]|uniref:RICIN domain-containing protein n=1 Tax=Streptomyces sp. NPDC006459 TaxID=3154303 RepID=UPI0033AFB42A
MTFFRRASAAAAAVLFSGLLLAPTAGAAGVPAPDLRPLTTFDDVDKNGAQVTYGPYFIWAVHSGKCLDVAGGTGATGDGVNVQQWSCLGSGQTNQRWYLDHLGNGKYNIRAVHSGKCLDVEGGTGATGDGVNVFQWSCLGSGQTNQQWAFSVD